MQPLRPGRKKNQENLPLARSDISRRERYTEILRLRELGHTYQQIASVLNVSKRTISIVLNGEIENLCRDSRKSILDPYLNKIAEGIQAGKTVMMIYDDLGRPGSRTNFYSYAQGLAERLGLSLVKSKRTPKIPGDGGTPVQAFEYLKRNHIFHCLWDEKAFSDEQRRYLEENHPVVMELQKRIREFRLIFEQQNPCMLRLFIESCSQSEHSRIANFAKGLRQDFDAVDFAVSSAKSNAFVEGSNNKIKMVKRVMYGRCGIKLLKAKLAGMRLVPFTA